MTESHIVLLDPLGNMCALVDGLLAGHPGSGSWPPLRPCRPVRQSSTKSGDRDTWRPRIEARRRIIGARCLGILCWQLRQPAVARWGLTHSVADASRRCSLQTLWRCETAGRSRPGKGRSRWFAYPVKCLLAHPGDVRRWRLPRSTTRPSGCDRLRAESLHLLPIRLRLAS